MTATLFCHRHGQTASVLGCEHVNAAVSAGSEPPPFRRLRLTDQGRTVACCVCFACVNRFGIASDFSSPPDAELDDPKFPKIHPICVMCLEATQSPRGVDLAAISGLPSTSRVANTSSGAAVTVPTPEGITDRDAYAADRRPRAPLRPTQVSAAVLLLCIPLAIDALSWRWTHLAPGGPFLFNGLLMLAVNAWLTYNIWMGRYWARGVFAVLFGLWLVLWILAPGSPGAKMHAFSLMNWSCIVPILLNPIALYLLFTDPGNGWFDTESPVP